MKNTFPSVVIFLILIFISIHTLPAQETPALEWAKSFGVNSSYDIARTITTDATGNVFSSGSFRNTIDFDPGGDVFNLTAIGFDNRGPYILKLDPDGNFLWAKTFTSTNDCSTGAITTDASGNLYISGSFNGTVDFDPGPGTFNITNGGTFTANFMCKLDADGNFLWATHTESNNSQAIASLAVDAAQNLYTLGHFRGVVDFDPGAGSATLSPFGQWDVYISKADANGNFISVQRMGGTDFDFGGSIGIDATDNVYVSGVFQGTADFDPGAATVNMTSTGLRDIFVVKLTTDGNFVWAKMLGGATTDELGMATKTDEDGNTYGTGLYSGTLDLDPGASVVNLTSSGGTDFFVLKLDADGDFVWAKSAGSTTHDDRITGIDIHPEGIYLVGYFNGTGDLDPGPDVFEVSVENDSFTLKLDTDGNFVWAVTFGDYGAGFVTKVLAVDNVGNVFTSAGFTTTVDFDPDPCVPFELTSSTIYVQKLSLAAQPPPPCEEPEPEENLLAIYNAISADGNSLNEIFRIENITAQEETSNNTVTIYNRWGDIVFDVSNYDNDERVFTGVGNSGKDLPSGIYYYKIEFSSGLKTKTGYLSLKR